MDSPKDPVKVRAGKTGATRRWGSEPRTVRLDDLTPPQRRLVLALVDAAKSEAAAEGQSPATAQEARRAAGDHPTAA